MHEEEFSLQKVELSLWKKLWQLIMVHQKKLYKAFLIMFFVAAIEVIFPIMNRWAIDTFIEKQELDTLLIFGVAFFILIVVQAFVVYLFIYKKDHIKINIEQTLKYFYSIFLFFNIVS